MRKMRMSDIIEEFIKELFDEEDSIEIQRNELAEQFKCVPSQINYVIATRFKPSQGYYVESRRGGGGHITIKKVNNTKSDYIMHIINNIGSEITSNEVDILISDFLTYDIIQAKEAKLIKVATSDNVLRLDKDIKDKVRARIFKNMLLNLSQLLEQKLRQVFLRIANKNILYNNQREDFNRKPLKKRRNSKCYVIIVEKEKPM